MLNKFLRAHFFLLFLNSYKLNWKSRLVVNNNNDSITLRDIFVAISSIQI